MRPTKAKPLTPIGERGLADLELRRLPAAALIFDLFEVGVHDIVFGFIALP